MNDLLYILRPNTLQGWPDHIIAYTLGPTVAVSHLWCKVCGELCIYNGERGTKWNTEVSRFAMNHLHSRSKYADHNR